MAIGGFALVAVGLVVGAARDQSTAIDTGGAVTQSAVTEHFAMCGKKRFPACEATGSP